MNSSYQIREREKPIAPGSLEQLRVHHLKSFYNRNNIRLSSAWPCLACNCRGSIYDPDDPPCPIEGYKMVGRIKCSVCNGAGLHTRAAFVAYRCELVAKYKQELASWKAAMAIWKKIKLTERQINVILRFGFPDPTEARKKRIVAKNGTNNK